MVPGIPSGLSAREVDRRLRDAVIDLRRAEQRAVLWFAEVLHRRLYRDLGFGSIHQYAAIALGFGLGKTAQFVRLARAFRELPRLRATVARGELTWTQARTVAGVATPRTEAAWLNAARGTSSRVLEEQVRVARRRARMAGAGTGQAVLRLEGSGPEPGRSGDGANAETGKARRKETDGETSKGTSKGASTEKTKGKSKETSHEQWEEKGKETEVWTEREDIPPVPPVGSLPLPRSVHLRFSPEQGARYEALLEAARKRGAREGREDLLLAGLEALVVPGTAGLEVAGEAGGGAAGGGAKGRGRHGGPPGRVFASPYQVLVQLCPSCAGGSVATHRGAEPLHPEELRAILCDARVRRRGKRNRAVIPAGVRREVLERDGYRCRSAGCGSARFLAVHHRTPREAGGTNDPENLVTLCASCHRAIHGHHEQGPLRDYDRPGPRGRSRGRDRNAGRSPEAGPSEGTRGSSTRVPKAVGPGLDRRDGTPGEGGTRVPGRGG